MHHVQDQATHVFPSSTSSSTQTLVLTQEGKESEHTLGNTGPRRFLVVEFDTGGIDEQDAGRKYGHCGDNAADGQRLRRRQYGQRLHQAAERLT